MLNFKHNYILSWASHSQIVLMVLLNSQLTNHFLFSRVLYNDNRE